MPQDPRKSNAKVTLASDNFYADYRVRSGAVPVFREDRQSPPEALLQAIWQHQRLVRAQLRTLDGRPLRILHPGFKNVESGPDFRGAVVQFGDDSPATGDVEVDLRSSGWRAHQHDRNPAFKNVVLQAVWESERPALNGPPVLELRPLIDAPIGELSLWLGSEAVQDLPDELRGKCCAPLRALATDQLRELLDQAALVRLQSKAAQLAARARQAGWDQALWEGLFRALGYKHNVWPMQRLGELRPRWRDGVAEQLAIESRLFGIGGLLPAELTRSQSGADQHIRRIWDCWWRERDTFSDCLLPRELWRFHGLRPANHPQRRLALASRWSAVEDLPGRLAGWCAGPVRDAQLASSLLKVFQVRGDDYWAWHYTLRSPRLKSAQPLVGEARVTDLAVNVVLPWLWIRAVEGQNELLRSAIEQRYFAWPAAQDNALLRQARARLLGGPGGGVFKHAAPQQGLMQMIRDFCERTNALCDNCKLPGLVAEFSRGKHR